MDLDLENIIDTGTTLLTALGLKVIGAIIAWFVGRALIKFGVRLMTAALDRQPVDPTLTRYVGNIVNVGLTTALIVALLGYFGVETTSFAALIAGVGVAIGAAWAGLLSNFSAGAFLVVLRPFKVGDYVKVAGIDGTVAAATIQQQSNAPVVFLTAHSDADTISRATGSSTIS